MTKDVPTIELLLLNPNVSVCVLTVSRVKNDICDLFQ